MPTKAAPLDQPASPKFDHSSIYAKGEGVSQDDAEAVRWFRLAAEQGDAEAQYNLGLIFVTGTDVPQDDTVAAKWFRLAADQGRYEAQFRLACMYEAGFGVPQDYVLAHMWFNLAVAVGGKDAVSRRDEVAERMTLDQINEAQRLAREWKPKAER